ncbi:hypothetical protein SLEP1_g5021 [Rubroshorea leprosula]|uniref:Uncharacterized protein n=1 Tax=Rubroshorea leprosula TaxID=152421 RepID=A0AAV5I144_9ROSI|nr:hypothetical protein SLEP1_g5021 [Rubroshorea leprosula]
MPSLVMQEGGAFLFSRHFNFPTDMDFLGVFLVISLATYQGQFEDMYEGGWMEYCFQDQFVAYLSIILELGKTLFVDA